MTTSREIHRQKKPFSFGLLMVPVLLAVIALIVYFGIKAYMSPSDGPALDVPPSPAPAAQSTAPAENHAAVPAPAASAPSAPASSSGEVALPELPSLDSLPAVNIDAVEVTPLVNVPAMPSAPSAKQPAAAVKQPTATVKQPAVTAPALKTPAPSQSKPAAGKTLKAVNVKPLPAKTAPAAAKPATAPAKAPAVTGGGYSVQAGSFTSDKAASDVAADLKNRGYQTRVIRADVKGRAFYRVFVKAGSTPAEAASVESAIKALQKYDTLVVKD